MSATTSGRAHRLIRAGRCFAYPFDVRLDGMPHSVRTIEFGDPEIAQWHQLPGLPGFAMRAHEGDAMVNKIFAPASGARLHILTKAHHPSARKGPWNGK